MRANKLPLQFKVANKLVLRYDRCYSSTHSGTSMPPASRLAASTLAATTDSMTPWSRCGGLSRPRPPPPRNGVPHTLLWIMVLTMGPAAVMLGSGMAGPGVRSDSSTPPYGVRAKASRSVTRTASVSSVRRDASDEALDRADPGRARGGRCACELLRQPGDTASLNPPLRAVSRSMTKSPPVVSCPAKRATWRPEGERPTAVLDALCRR